MESENTVTYFLFNDRKGTSRCSFILICSLTFFELYSCFTYILPLLYPQYATILFCLPLFFLSFHTYFIATTPPIRLLFALLHLNILHYINKKTSPFQFYSSPSRARLQSFQPSFPPPFLSKLPPFSSRFSPSLSQQKFFFYTTSIPLQQRHGNSIVQ